MIPDPWIQKNRYRAEGAEIAFATVDGYLDGVVQGMRENMPYPVTADRARAFERVCSMVEGFRKELEGLRKTLARTNSMQDFFLWGPPPFLDEDGEHPNQESLRNALLLNIESRHEA